MSEYARSLLGGAGLLLVTSGCVAAQRDDSLRLSEELGRARAQAAWERARAAEVEARAALLESRVARLEQSASERATAQRVEATRIIDRLDRMLQVTQSLATEHVTDELASESGMATAPSPTSLAPSQARAAQSYDERAESTTTGTSDPELRALAKRLLAARSGPHGLSRDEERALRLLLRSERKLDTTNPWSEALY